ncbi:MAG: hypothetical protein AAGG51_00605 [Cyanobacteria bacterium P01_G01_bin.54]
MDYAPLLPVVLVPFVQYPYLSSIPNQNEGFLSYKEVIFFVPVINRKDARSSEADPLKSKKGILSKIEKFLGNVEDGTEGFVDDIEDLLEDFALFIPFIFVDTSMAMISGKEIYGYPKQWGWIELPADPELSQPFSLEAVAWQTFGVNSQAVRQHITQIMNQTQTNDRLKAANPADLEADRESVKARLLQRVSQYIDSQSTVTLTDWGRLIDILLVIITHVLKKPIDNVFLKEFRDTVDGTKACYQAVLKAAYDEIKVSEFEYLHDHFVVDIPEVESMPLKAQLGLRPISDDQPNRFISLLAFHMVFDFHLTNGTILWQAGAT